MGQGLHVLGNVMLETQDRTDTVAGVVDPTAIPYSTVSSNDIP